MILFKSCLKCSGDLFSEGTEIACLQCGYRGETARALQGNPNFKHYIASRIGVPIHAKKPDGRPASYAR